MKQQRVGPNRRKQVQEQAVEEVVADDSGADLLSDLDELLDEIDAVLEEQGVLTAFRQRSGQ